jgi:hypothetical protein
MSYNDAEKLFHRNERVGKSAFQRFLIAILNKLCDAYGLRVEGTGKRPGRLKKKSDYIISIFNFVSDQCFIHYLLTKMMETSGWCDYGDPGFKSYVGRRPIHGR